MKHVTENGCRVIRVFDWCYQCRAHCSPYDGNRCVHSCRPTKCWLRPSDEPSNVWSTVGVLESRFSIRDRVRRPPYPPRI